MLAAAIVLAVLALLLLMRAGIIVEYSEAGLNLWLKVAFIKLRVQQQEKKAKPKKKRQSKLGDLKPGSLREFMDILKIIGEVLKRIKRKLLIKKLILHYTSASDDPSKTALQYGAANAVFGVIIPILEQNFRIKKRDLRATADFNRSDQGIYAYISLSIAIWESIYVLSALLRLFSVAGRKDGKKDGKPADE